MQHPIKRSCAVSALTLAASLLALPTAQAEGFRPLVGVSATGGGETLVTVRYNDGSNQDVRSGGLIHLFGGFEYQSAGLPIGVQANIGFHVDDTNAKNGSVSFRRFPLEVLGFWQIDETWRLAAGLRKSSGVKLSSSGALSSVGDLKLSAKTGLVLQGEYFISPQASVLLRWVQEEYSVGRVKVDGNHLGLGMSYRF